MPKTITQNEYLQLVGLLALARHHNRMLTSIREAAVAITGETNCHGEIDMNGHTSDAIHCDYDVSELLGKLKITVEQADQSFTIGGVP